MTVTYSDPAQPPFIILPSGPFASDNMLGQLDDAWFFSRPGTVIASVDGTEQAGGPNDWLKLIWAEGQRVNLEEASSGPTVLNRVESPVQTVVLDWTAYPFVRSLAGTTWNGYKPDDRLAWFWGVHQITEKPPKGSDRVTLHKRLVPARNSAYYGGKIWTGGCVQPKFEDRVAAVRGLGVPEQVLHGRAVGQGDGHHLG